MNDMPDIFASVDISLSVDVFKSLIDREVSAELCARGKKAWHGLWQNFFLVVH